MEVQTRSDFPYGKYAGLTKFDSVKDAYNAYKCDPNIWKISWMENDQRITYLPKKRGVIWGDTPEWKLTELCPKYLNSPSREVFWLQYSPKGILLSVLTDSEFREKFCQIK